MSMKKEMFGTALRGYFRETAGWLGGFFGFVVCFALLGWLCGLPGTVALYGALLCLAGLLAGCAFGFWRHLQRLCSLRELDTLRDPSELPPPQTQTEAEYDRLLRQLYKEKGELLAESRENSRRQLDTFSLWTHQIKVPISAMKLLLQDRPDAASATLLCELFKVEQYADMALNYARMNASSTDYVLRACDLDALLRKVLRRFAPLFIQKKLRLCYEPVSCSLLTDEKWFSFAVEQILSNAVKYTKSGSVTVTVDTEKQLLSVADTGIGIAPEDLPRVFEQGYTGGNGREHQRATGLGLYLCREALNRLGHSIRLESTLGEGTTVFVGLEREEREYE